ncbi:hypothetical protein TRFO_15027 [Tritrichomonas foetus]|uniref:Uncharacterized protein n=1 Tax=Tritrichomonas foetus TaxID=1144522 RepID=A0A1J4KTA2_9EUKA|nr:hypothetical protein TRFO_15027 [Tritrichomonas foetus]|eukprot:OHT14519.1 hypothetical protein TRFO_15027 [Tritrichomonas foetus]
MEILDMVKIVKENDANELKRIKDAEDLKCSNFTLDCPNSSGFIPYYNITILHAAAFYDSLECFIFLIDECGFTYREESANSYFPLHYACCSGAYEVASYILEKDPEEAKMVPPGLSHHFLFFAAIGGNPEIMRELFEKGADLSNRANTLDDPIGRAVMVGNIACLKILLEHGKIGASGDNSPIINSVINSRPDATMILLESASPEDIVKFNREGKSFFTYAAFCGIKFKEPVLYALKLIGSLPIEVPRESPEKGVCHWICQFADLEIAEAMLSTRFYDINRYILKAGSGPYQLLDRKDLKEDTIIQLLSLLIQKGFDLNRRENLNNNNGLPDTPSLLEKICLFTMIKLYKVIGFLIDHGADPMAPCVRNGKPLYDNIKERKMLKLLEVFDEHMHK